MLIRTLQFRYALIALVLLTAVTRLPSLLHPRGIDDETAYSVVANEIVDGGLPFVDAVERKPPLVYWTYAAVFGVAGKYNWMALHAAALAWTLGTMAGLYVIGRRLFNRETGLIAALLYSVFQPWVTWKNLAFNGELLMNLPIVWAWAIAFGRSSSRMRPELLLAGVLLCAGFLLKQPAAFAAVPLGIYLLLPSYRASRGLTPTQSIAHATLLTVGFLGALGAVIIVLLKQGILRDAFYWTITNHTDLHVFWDRALLLTPAFVAICWPLFVGAALAYRNNDGVWAGKRAERTALFGLLAVSALGTAAGGRYYPHYYIQLIPPLVLLAAPHCARLWLGREQSRHWLLRPAIAYAWLALVVVGFSIVHWAGLLSQRQPTEAGRYLLEHSAVDDRIFVWGQEPKFYLDARRRPASRYILILLFTGYDGRPNVDTRDRIVPDAWRTLEEDFRKHPPVYIIDLHSNPGARYPVRDFPILAKLLAEHYAPVTRTAEGLIYRRR
jgi:4-amino-4-deoxy-L-arabinose transferase-like glycosyltransferase